MTEEPYVPKGKDIVTTNGCVCKNKYKSTGEKNIKNPAVSTTRQHPGVS